MFGEKKEEQKEEEEEKEAERRRRKGRRESRPPHGSFSSPGPKFDRKEARGEILG